MLLNHANGTFSYFVGKSSLLLHDFILSGNEASSKPGAIHLTQCVNASTKRKQAHRGPAQTIDILV